MRFEALHFGPLASKAGALVIYIRAIGYVRRINRVFNPIGSMEKAKLLLHGANPLDGPPARNLPISREDLACIRKSMPCADVNADIMFCAIAIGGVLNDAKHRISGIRLEGREGETTPGIQSWARAWNHFPTGKGRIGAKKSQEYPCAWGG